MEYIAKNERYETMKYNRCGKSGLKLPAMSLGLWHNFGDESVFSNSKKMVLGAFDRGITHFDLANNYGPSNGSAEETFGKIINEELKPYRDEIIVTTKAGYYMWPGPYGEWGSKKSLIASLDQSLSRMKLEYVDIFYHHRFDPDTPLEETMDALASVVRSGKALYVGISNYSADDTAKAADLLKRMDVPCLIHQMQYSLLNQENESVLDVVEQKGMGAIAFSPLAQGLLTGKYLNGIPLGSRAASNSVFLSSSSITSEVLDVTRRLGEIAQRRGQSLAQMALAWVLNDTRMTSVILGASKLEQIDDNLKALESASFTEEEIKQIDSVLNQGRR